MTTMKTTEHFKAAILAYLQERAKTDEVFAARMKLPNKSIDECVKFILNTVKESGCNGFHDDEVYGIAVHYYDEDKLDPKYLKEISGNVVVNHHVTLSESEKKELEEKARKDYYDECMRKQRELVNRPKKKVEKKEERQLTLFDL